MTKNKIYFRSFFTAIFLLILVGCQKKINKISTSSSWNPSIAVPIGEANFLISDLLVNIDSGIIVGPLGAMSIEFEENLDSVLATDFISLDDFTEIFDLTPSGLVPAPIFPNGTTLSNSASVSTSYNAPSGVEINTLNFSGGTLDLTVTSTFQHDAELNITISDIFDANSSPIVTTISLVYTGGGTTTQTVSIDLTDYSADFTAGGTLTNSLRATIDVTITGTGTPGNPIVGNEIINLTLGLNNLEYENITGYFGQDPLTSASDSLLLKIFQNINNQGDLTFTNPSLTFDITNSFGVPIDINFGNFESIDSITSQSSSLVLSEPSLSINAPSSFGQSVNTQLTLNNQNTTNIETILGVNPKYFKYDISAIPNPNGNAGQLNFIESTSKMVVKASLDLPFEGKAYGISAKDTLDYSLEDTDVSSIESLMFRFNVDNGFPISFSAQAIFTDENYNPIFSLFDTPTSLANGANIDAEGKVSSSVKNITNVKLMKEQVDLLGNVKHIIIDGVVNTTDYQNSTVKFYDSYGISLKLGFLLEIKN
jgi:hypothetical protein